ncbi:CaiB/BaiF CoA transferase family protein [Profundibacter sp.]
MTLPLDGLRIIAIEQYGAGPFATQHLADLGAEVIKIENPDSGGDVGRAVGPHFTQEGDSLFYQSFNRNKKSITLDLKSKEGLAHLHRLAKKADVVFNNLRGDLPAKLKLTYDDLKEANPAIVCAHLSAYGRTGSRAAWPGYDYLMQAEAGYLSVTGEPAGPPARFGLSIVDLMTGTTAALAMVSAVLGARSTGQGRDIDVSLFDVALHNLTYVATWYLNEGDVVGRVPRSGHPSLVPSQLYRTKDGWLFIMCNKEKFWGVLADHIDKPEWKTDPRYCDYAARLKHRDTLTVELDEVLSTSTTAEWLARLTGHVPVAPVNDMGQALDNPFVTEQGMVVETPHPVLGKIRLLASPIRCPGEEMPQNPAPRLGADNDSFLSN